MTSLTSIHQLLAQAKEAEQAEDLPAALTIYQQVLTLDVLSETAYNRLMIAYRKMKDPKKELSIINKGVKAFEQHYKSRKSRVKKIAAVSEKLSKALGLTDKKGNSTYDPEPIATWRKRKAVVEKKLGK